MQAGSDADIERAILARLAGRPGKTIEPTEIARDLVGGDPQAWSRLMPAVRRVAIHLMKRGRLTITRKGRAVDPDDFRGTYRLAAPPGDDPETGPGNSEALRPVAK